MAKMISKRISVSILEEDLELLKKMAKHWNTDLNGVMIIAFKNGFAELSEEYFEELEEV